MNPFYIRAVWEDTMPYSPTFNNETVYPIAELIKTSEVPNNIKIIEAEGGSK